MKWLAAILAVVVAGWVIPFPDDVSWQVALGANHLTIAILFQAWLSAIRAEGLLFRSAVALLCVDAWASLVVFSVWQATGQEVDMMLPVFIVFTAWLVVVLKRHYDIGSDAINKANVNILLLKPVSFFALARSLIGYPVSSLCVVAGGYVWAFRHRSGRFEKSRYSSACLKTHIAIDTGVTSSKAIIEELNNVVGSSRFPYLKCVFALRKVFDLMGGAYKIKIWLDYIPGVYARKLLGRKHINEQFDREKCE